MDTMEYTKNGKVNLLYSRLIEWLEDMGVPAEHRQQYAKDIIGDVIENATIWHNNYANTIKEV